MTDDPILTKKFLDDEITTRTAEDAYLANYGGQPLSGGLPANTSPNYVYYSLINLTNGMNLTQSVNLLDWAKNSKIAAYTYQGTVINPTQISMSVNTGSTGLHAWGSGFRINVNNVSAHKVVTAVGASYGSFSVIGASASFVSGISVTYGYVYITV